MSEQDSRPASKDAMAPTRFLLVTGMSGAGKSSALKALEDLGYEAVDNMPLSLLPSLIGAGETRSTEERSPVAIGVDIRTRDFGVDELLAFVDTLADAPGLEVRLVFLDCEDEVLRRRYTETRRRHPLAADRPVLDGIRHERRMVLALRDRSDLVIDTTDFALNDLRQLVRGHFSLDIESKLAISVVSFSFRRGLPREADLVFDARFLKNPHYEPDLRARTGLDPEVAAFIAADAGFEEFFEAMTGLVAPLLPRFQQEGKTYLTIAIGCTGGQHRSVYVADRLTAWLTGRGEQASVAHRELLDSADTAAR